MKKTTLPTLFILTCLTLVLVTIFTGCSQPTSKPAAPATSTAAPAPAPAPSAKPSTTAAPASTPATTVKPIVIRINDFGSPRAYSNSWNLFWGPEMEKRTNGRIKVQYFWQEALGPQKERTTGIGSGLFEAGPCVPATEIGRLYLSNIAFLPMIEPNCYVMAKSLETVYKLPKFQEMFDKLNCISMYPLQLTDYALGANFQFKTTDDWKGKRIRAQSDQITLIKEYGATPVAMATPEVFGAMEKKSIDGCLFTYDSLNVYGIMDIAKYVTNVRFGACCANFLMGKKFFNSLPADLQKIVMDVNADTPAASWQQWKDENAKIKAKWTKGGVTVSDIPDTEFQKMYKVAVEKIWPAGPRVWMIRAMTARAP